MTADLPFAMLGIDSDNDISFMSQAAFDSSQYATAPSATRQAGLDSQPAQ